MYKKIIGLVLAGMMSLLVVGCGNDTVEYQEPQVQQEEYQEPQDEDLTKEYQEEINKEEQLIKAKELVDSIIGKNFDSGDYEIITDEESNTVMIVLITNANILANGLIDGSYYTLKENMIENSLVGKDMLEKCGLDVNYCVALGNVAQDKVWLSVLNGQVLYDFSQK